MRSSSCFFRLLQVFLSLSWTTLTSCFSFTSSYSFILVSISHLLRSMAVFYLSVSVFIAIAILVSHRFDIILSFEFFEFDFLFALINNLILNSNIRYTDCVDKLYVSREKNYCALCTLFQPSTI